MLGRMLRQLRRLNNGRAQIPTLAPETAPAVQDERAETFFLPFEIRPAELADLPHLPAIFRAAIANQAGAPLYTDQQLNAWATSADNHQHFQAALQEGTTIIAERHGQAVAFAQLAPADTLRMLYVHPDACGLGIATLMCQYLEDEARIAGSDTLTTDASLLALKFFEGMGFRELERRNIKRNGIALEQALMEKRLK